MHGEKRRRTWETPWILHSQRSNAGRKAGEALKGKPGPRENAWRLNEKSDER
jgi:hypothetical protein